MLGVRVKMCDTGDGGKNKRGYTLVSITYTLHTLVKPIYTIQSKLQQHKKSLGFLSVECVCV
jgi:hypothetical protein